MAQFDIVENRGRSAKTGVPYLLDIQSDAVSILETRIVAPLRRKKDYPAEPISKLHIIITIDNIDNIDYIAFISEMAAIPGSLLGDIVGNAGRFRTDIITAIDLLFTGF